MKFDKYKTKIDQFDFFEYNSIFIVTLLSAHQEKI